MTEKRSHHVLKLDPDSSNPELGLAGFRYADLYSVDRLRDLLKEFDRFVSDEDALLYDRFDAYRSAVCDGSAHGGLGEAEESKLLVELSEHLATFLVRMFGVELEAESLRLRAGKDAEVARFKKDFVAKRVVNAPADEIPSSELERLDRTVEHLIAALTGEQPHDDREFGLAVATNRLLSIELEYPAATPAAKLTPLPEARAELQRLLDELRAPEFWSDDFASFVSRREPLSPDIAIPEAVERERQAIAGILQLVTRWAAARANVEREGKFRLNPLGAQLEGGPLDERIGEMNCLCRSGNSVAALAVVMIDNPTVPGTGHRFCNDCMKAGIFQKQDPIDIPQIETGMLTDVLSLPYGFEIYALLSRWNPLNARRPVMQPYNGVNVLVVGLGSTVAHHLANEGFGVVGIDGLKIEPLPKELVGSQDEFPRPIIDARCRVRRDDLD